MALIHFLMSVFFYYLCRWSVTELDGQQSCESFDVIQSSFLIHEIKLGQTEYYPSHYWFIPFTDCFHHVWPIVIQSEAKTCRKIC